MRYEGSTMHDEIETLLELYTLEELFEVLDITPYEVISILLNSGHIELPEYVSREEQTESDQTD